MSQSTSSSPSLTSGPILLIEPERWHTIFLRNFGDLLWPARLPSLHLSSSPGEFWPDVFVSASLPWRKIPVSAALHISVVAVILVVTRFWPQPAQVVTQAKFNSNDVISFPPSEYLPPLDTGGEHELPIKHGEPAYAPQPIISVPREATNHTQTIVTPPDVKLKNDVPMPNVVAWKQAAPAVPIAATENLQSRKAPVLPSAVVAPAPALTQLASQRVTLVQPTAVAPQPELQMNLSRRIDEINIGHQQVVAPAPQLPIAESHTSLIAGLDSIRVAAPPPTINLTERQRGVALPQSAAVAPAPNIQISPSRRLGNGLAREQVVVPAPNISHLNEHTLNRIALGRTNEAVPPAPVAQSLASKNNDRQIIALNLHPSVQIAQPQGNRRGTFAATPQGKQNAAGTPDGITSSAKISSPNKPTNALPAGLHVGTPENSKQQATAGSSNTQTSSAGSTDANNHPLVASVTVPRISSSGHLAKEVPESSITEEDRKVFGGHKFYAMAMNFANLNSSGGSWIFHFAEQKNPSEKGDLMAPEVDHQVDPAYPTDLMQHNVHGTVVLYAVIGSDGSVSSVKVLESVDDRLDEYAREALSKWHFLPATRNGNPVALTMVVKVPFRPSRNIF